MDPKTYQIGRVFRQRAAGTVLSLKRLARGVDEHPVTIHTPRSAQAALVRFSSNRTIFGHLVRSSLIVTALYLVVRGGAARRLDDTVLPTDRIAVEALVFLVAAALSLTLFVGLPMQRLLRRIGARILASERELVERNTSQRFLRDVGNAFEMADNDNELVSIAALALRDAGPGDAELLVADASNAHVERLVVAADRAAPGCGLTTPRSCPAVRRGQTLKFADPNGLSACPRLRERNLDDGVIATCVPINVLGAPSAVLHAIVRADLLDDEAAAGIKALEGVAVRFGTRLGMLRAISQSRLQADTDPLTGLLNRRAMENHVRELQGNNVPFAVAMADLDHFKDLNDTYGHDTGDRALRLFSRVLQSSVRDGDHVSRHGGEEFVVVLPNNDADGAAPVLHRLRQRLSAALTDAQLPVFTVSAGLTDSSTSPHFSELLNNADRALMAAKRDGRDRIVFDETIIESTTTSH
jgi:diguanylate cyclase (GGDEF)-like protein